MTSKRENGNSDCKYVGDGKIGSGRTKLFSSGRERFSSAIYLNVSAGPAHQVCSRGCGLFSMGTGLTAFWKGNIEVFWSSENSVVSEPTAGEGGQGRGGGHPAQLLQLEDEALEVQRGGVSFLRPSS